MDIAKQIVKFRNQKGYSTTKLAKLAGIAQSTLREIEIGNTSPTWDTIEKVCSALEISPIALLDNLISTDCNSLPSHLQELVDTAKQLPPNQLKHLSELLKAMKEEN